MPARHHESSVNSSTPMSRHGTGVPGAKVFPDVAIDCVATMGSDESKAMRTGSIGYCAMFAKYVASLLSTTRKPL